MHVACTIHLRNAASRDSSRQPAAFPNSPKIPIFTSYNRKIPNSLSANPLNINLNFPRKTGLYRYPFQRQEVSKEYWEGAVEFKYRVEDARLGRFFSVDPLYAKYPWNSNYAFSENRLIDGIELEGLEYTSANGKGLGPRNASSVPEGATLDSRFVKESAPVPNLNSPLKAPKEPNRSIDSSPVPKASNWVMPIPKITLNLTAAAGIKAKAGPVTFGANAGGVVVLGWDDDDFFVAGDNKNNDQGREVFKGYNLAYTAIKSNAPSRLKKEFDEAFFTTGFEYKSTFDGTINGRLISEKITEQYFFFMYKEVEYNYSENTTTETLGVSIDFSYGLGLIVNGGIKAPFYISKQ